MWTKERQALKKEIKPSLWNHNDMAHMLEDKDYTEHILKFLKETEVGNRTKEKEKELRDEERDEINGWEELMDHPWVEGLDENEDDDEDDEELMAWEGDGEGHIMEGIGVG
jgi:hypothetical protein